MKRGLISSAIVIIAAFFLTASTPASAANCHWQRIGIESVEEQECYMESQLMCVEEKPKPVLTKQRATPADDPQRCLHKGRCMLA